MTPRKAALRAISALRRHGAWIEDTLETLTENMVARDAAFTTWLSYGVVQKQNYIDWLIARQSSMGLEKIEPQVLDCLRLGVFQLIESGSIPASAAVNETVKLVRGCANARAAGFANAVLRRIAEAVADRLPLPPREDILQYCETMYSLPRWIIDEFAALVGDDVELLCAALNDVPKTTLQFLPVRIDKETLRVELENAGLQPCDHPAYEHCLQVESAAGLAKLPSWAAGHVWVADAGAMTALAHVDVTPGMKILDACAAPGGKTFGLVRHNGTAEVTACDISPRKVEELQQSIARMGLCDVVSAQVQSAETFVSAWQNSFDLVVADLPCSGLGVLAKKPDIRVKKREEVAHLPKMQLKMLDNLSRYVKPGGQLLYITCTLRQEENEDIMRCFEAAHEDFEALHEETLLPHVTGTDGFYFALFRKNIG